jgi:hypothetical protein
MRIGKMEIYQQIADELNQKEILPPTARHWKGHNVQSFVSRGCQDPIVKSIINKHFTKANQTQNDTIIKD